MITQFNSKAVETDHYLFYPNFTITNTMEDKKVTPNPHSAHSGMKSLDDLRKELNALTSKDALALTGGKTLEKDKWNSWNGGIVPQ